MRLRAALLILWLGAAPGFAKKKNPDATQTLEVPKDPPMVATGQTSRLLFTVSPLSAKGLLSQQTRDALKAILKANGGATVIHVRALVAGSGDLRRVPQIVSEVFTDKHMALPSVSVVQVGALPLEGAQVVIEAVSEGKKDINPEGLTFGTGETVEQALHGAMPLMATCFVNALAPVAGANVVQMRREVGRGPTVCEAVGRGGNVKDQRLAFSGTQVALGSEEKTFQRLERELAGARVIGMNVYVVSRRPTNLAPNATVVPVEGVASADATFAVDAVAAP